MTIHVKDLIPVPLIIVIFGCTLSASICGNVYIVLSILNFKYMKNVTNIFIGSKSVSDLMAGCFMSIFTMMQNIEPQRARGHICEPPVFVELTCVSASIFSILAVGVDRYLAVLHPTLKYITPKKAVLLVLTIWIISALYSLRLVVQFRDMKTDECKMFFDEKENDILFRLIDFFCLFLIPMAVMSFMYFRIGKYLWKKERVTATVLRKRRVVKFLVLSLVFFCVSWGPFYVCEIERLASRHPFDIGEEGKVHIIIRFVFIVIAICNGFLTPLAYILCLPHTRVQPKKVLSLVLGYRSRVTSVSPWTKIVYQDQTRTGSSHHLAKARGPFFLTPADVIPERVSSQETTFN